MAFSINGEEIPDEVIEQEFAQIKGHYEQMLKVSCCERDDEFRGYAKENIAGRVLINQEAKAKVAEPTDEEIQTAIEKLYEEHGGEDQFYYAMGMPYKDEDIMKQNVAQSLRVEKLVDEACSPLPEPSDEELKAHYEKHIDLFKTAEEVQASHITKDLGSAESRAEAYDHLREIRRRVREDGEDFVKIATDENDNKEQPVDLGFFKRGEFMEEFEAIAFSMDKGETSPVFTTHLGMHLCYLTDRKPAEAIPLEEAKDQVLAHLLNGHREETVEALVSDLRANATIVDEDPEEEDEDPAPSIILEP